MRSYASAFLALSLWAGAGWGAVAESGESNAAGTVLNPVAVPAKVSAAVSAAVPELTAAQIVAKNAAARGGLEAWRKVQSMVWSGHIERAGTPSQNVPFLMELKRPDKTRFEIKTMNQTAVRAYDGAQGWKQSPSTATGIPEVQPYTTEELRFARDAQAFDGPLLDSEAKGNAISLDGVDSVEGRQAYRLSVRLPSGVTNHVWVDAETFLEVKYDRATRNVTGMGQVSVMYRDYRTFEGVQIPVTIETAGGMSKASDKMVIEKISLNPPLDDRMFAKPRAPGNGRHTVAIGADGVQAPAKLPEPVRQCCGAFGCLGALTSLSITTSYSKSCSIARRDRLCAIWFASFSLREWDRGRRGVSSRMRRARGAVTAGKPPRAL